MTLPYLPPVPTESLHKFLAIGGLVLLLVPLPYIESLLEETEIEAIHLDAEREVLTLQIDRYKREMDAIGNAYKGINSRLQTVLPPDTPRTEAQRQALKQELGRITRLETAARTSLDSANTAYKNQEDVAYQHQVALIHFGEKAELTQVKLSKIRILLGAALFFLFAGAAMVLVGFTWWWQKEGAPRFRIVWRKKPMEPVASTDSTATTSAVDAESTTPVA